MKKFGAVLAILIMISTSYSQSSKPIWNEDTGEITVKGKRYAFMEKKKSSIITGSDYWVKDSNEELIIQFIYETYDCSTYYDNGKVKEDRTCFRERIMFTDTGSNVHLDVTAFGFGKKSVLKVLTRNELIDTEGNLDWDKTMVYIRAKRGEIFQPEPEGPSETPVTISGHEIYQDDVLIGKFNKRGLDEYFIYNVYDIDAAKVMTAKIEKNDPFEWILTDNNGKESSVLYEDDQDGVKILTYLAKKGILYK